MYNPPTSDQKKNIFLLTYSRQKKNIKKQSKSFLLVLKSALYLVEFFFLFHRKILKDTAAEPDYSTIVKFLLNVNYVNKNIYFISLRKCILFMVHNNMNCITLYVFYYKTSGIFFN